MKANKLTTWLSIVLVFIFEPAILEAQTSFAYSLGGINDENAPEVITDSHGNIFMAGKFEGSVDFDPGPGVHIMTTTVISTPEMYIVKLDSAGHFLWCGKTTNQGVGDIDVMGLSIDASGRINISGRASGNLDFDPGAGTYLLNCGTLTSGFQLTIDNSGNFISALMLFALSSSDARIQKTLVDVHRNKYLIGSFYGNVDADPGPGTLLIHSNNSYGMFLVKLDSTNNFIYVKTVSGGDKVLGNDAFLTSNGYLCIGGTFSDNIDFDPGPGTFMLAAATTAGGSGAYILKLDTAGNFVWADAVAGSYTFNTGLVTLNHLMEDSRGNIVFSGYFDAGSGIIDFDPGLGQFVDYGAGVYLEKLDVNGLFKSAKLIEGRPIYPVGMSMDPAGNVYLCGEFQGTSNFNTTGGENMYYPVGGGVENGFTCKMDTAGNFVWVRTIPCSYQITPEAVAWIGSDGVVTVGEFNNSCTIGNTQLTSAGQHDIFITRMNVGSNLISGKMYYDMNSNGVYDAGDSPATQLVMKADTSYLINGIDSATANYSFYVDPGTHTLSFPNPPRYYTLTPATRTLNFANMTNAVSQNNDFVFTPRYGITDVSTEVVSLCDASPGYTASYNITTRNYGTDTVSGVLNLVFDPKLTFGSAIPIQQTVSGDTLTWNYTNLKPFETRTYRIDFAMTVNAHPGDTLSLVSTVTPLTGDSALANNTSHLRQPVKISFDPNGKLADLKPLLDSSFRTTPGYLTYTIHFQNTGTASAINILLHDTLDARDLDLGSLQVLSTSSRMNLTMQNDVATFYFPGINLSAVSINPARSIGQVTYRIKTKSTFTYGDTIRNSASIFFDYNAPVQTNATRHYLMTPQTANGILEAKDQPRIVCFPDPTKGQFTIQPAPDASDKILITDLTGRTVMARAASATVDISSLPDGIYLVKLLSKEDTPKCTGRMVKSE